MVTFNSTETRIVECQEIKLKKAEQVYNANFLLMEHSYDEEDEHDEDDEDDEDEDAEEMSPLLQKTIVSISQLKFLLNAEMNA